MTSRTPIPASENDPAPVVLRTIGPYRLLQRVATGGMSDVYRAYDERSRSIVALKVLSESLSQQPPFVRRFKREARLTQLLRHNQIVRGLESGYDRDSDKHYLAMEYIGGPKMAELLGQHGHLGVPIVTRIGIDIAEALSFLHRVKHLHRDVKPENILLDPIGTAKLADLGLVKEIETDSELTASNHGIGTPFYMPHEQAQNSSFVDERSDIFSLGATLYHLATGSVPFPGETQEEVEQGKRSGTFPPVRTVNRNVPDAVAAVLAKMLERDPRNRFARADDVVTALQATGTAATMAEFSNYLRAHSDPDTVPSPDPMEPTRPDLPPPVSHGTDSPNRSGLRPLVSVLLALGLVTWSVSRFRDRSADRLPARSLQIDDAPPPPADTRTTTATTAPDVRPL